MRVIYSFVLATWCLLDLSHGSAVQEPLKDKTQIPSAIRALTIQVPVDHFKVTDNRTYANRYWIHTEYYESGGPIFFYDAGERGVSERSVAYHFSDAHPVVLLARRFNGTAIVWEHRFFGASLPLPLTAQSTQDEREEALQYLNTEQALEDVVYFAKHFKPSDLETEIASPWIWIGGSYPGQRAAMIRKRNPDVFWASWSSSAPVQDSLNFPEYYLHVARDLPHGCRTVIQRVVRYIDDILANGTTVAKYRLRWEIAQRFSSGQSVWERFVFTMYAPNSVVAQHLRGVISMDWQSTGMSGGMNSTCAAIECTASKDQPKAIDTVLAAVLDATEANNNRQRRAVPDYPMDSTVWQHQVCTEYPYFRISGPSTQPYNILSAFLTEDSEWDHCIREFPWLTQRPDPSIPLKYTNWHANVSNVMWTTGLQDPWHGLSMAPVRSLVSGAPADRNLTQEVPACEAPCDGQNLFGLVFEEGRHCEDLNSGSKEGVQALELFWRALEVWLPCFYNS